MAHHGAQCISGSMESGVTWTTASCADVLRGRLLSALSVVNSGHSHAMPHQVVWMRHVPRLPAFQTSDMQQARDVWPPVCWPIIEERYVWSSWWHHNSTMSEKQGIARARSFCKCLFVRLMAPRTSSKRWASAESSRGSSFFHQSPG